MYQQRLNHSCRTSADASRRQHEIRRTTRPNSTRQHADVYASAMILRAQGSRPLVGPARAEPSEEDAKAKFPVVGMGCLTFARYGTLILLSNTPQSLIAWASCTSKPEARRASADRSPAKCPSGQKRGEAPRPRAPDPTLALVRKETV